MNTTFYNLLKDYEVIIPIIQRDYAQGRKDKGYIRSAFLKQINESISPDSKSQSSLDFIYGNIDEKNRFFPLDGQQRLTTLWLITWYVSWRSRKLDEDKKWLQKFSYETRSSSREFCKALLEKMNETELNETDSLGSYIKKQTWFYSYWLQDPTISSMLRTISGEKDDTDACIEGLFKKATDEEYEKFREKLMGDAISFELMVIGSEKLPVSDDLYIKMNARGKALTDFENFKADLVSWIQNDNNIEVEKFEESIPENESLKYYHYYPAQIDTAWTDVFWDFAKSNLGKDFERKTDEIFFAFINRFCFNLLCIAKNQKSEDCTKEEYCLNQYDVAKINDILGENKSKNENSKKIANKDALLTYSYFVQDNSIKYTNFDYYKKLLNFDNLKALDTILKYIHTNLETIENQLKIINDCVSIREKSDYHLLPFFTTKEGRKELKETTYKERLYFFAICKYFETIEQFEEDKFNDWMRFCRNLIENSGVDAARTMIDVLRKINNYDPKDILDELQKLDNVEKPTSALEKQIAEEIEKAKRIKIDPNIWKTKIRNTEDTFLCGKIGFLFINPEGNYCWQDFDRKQKAFYDFFQIDKYSKKGVAKLDFVKNFAKSFESFEKVQGKLIFHTKGWQSRGDSWLDIFKDDDLKRIHDILMGGECSVAKGDYKDFIDSNAFNDAVEKKGVFCGEKKQDLRIAWYKNSYALYKQHAQSEKLCFDYSSDKYLFKRNSILGELKPKGLSFESNQKIEYGSYFYGDDIRFKCNNIYYIWSSDDCIYPYDIEKGTKSKNAILKEASKKGADEIINLLNSHNNS